MRFGQFKMAIFIVSACFLIVFNMPIWLQVNKISREKLLFI